MVSTRGGQVEGTMSDMMSKSDEMVEGYLAGYKSGSYELPECHKGKSQAFKHGWLNGRDDGIQNPRDRASVLNARACMIIGKDGL